MAEDNSTVSAAPDAQPHIGDLIRDLLNIKGAVELSRRAVYGTMNLVDVQDHPEQCAEIISAVESTLTITESAIERLYEKLAVVDDAQPIGKAVPRA